MLAVPVEDVEVELRATFPQEGKFGLREDVGVAMERLDYVLDVRSAEPPERVARLVARATRACHAENSLRVPVPVEPVLRVNGEVVPFTQAEPPELRR